MKTKTLGKLLPALVAFGAAGLGFAQSWTNQDVGNPGVPGSTDDPAGAVRTIVGGGNDIWGSGDNFQFNYTKVSGAFDIQCRVQSLDMAHSWSKAGLFARESLESGSRNAGIVTTPTDGQNLFNMQWRDNTDGGSGSKPGGERFSPVPYPNAWIRLVREDPNSNEFKSYIDQTGASSTTPDWGTAEYHVHTIPGDLLPAELFVGIGVTSHDDALSTTAIVSDIKFNVGTFVPAAAPVVVTDPADVVVDAGGPASFSVTINDGDVFPPPTFQWKRDGADIPGATGTSYSIDRTTAADNGAKFSVVVSNSEGSVTSAEATLTVNTDVNPPTLTFVTGSASFTQVRVEFSEPLDQASAETASNYALSGGVTISGAALSAPPGNPGDNIVLLTTSQQPVGTMLTLTVNNVADAAGNPIAAGSTMDFSTFVWQPGAVLHEFWQDIPNDGSSLQGFKDDPRYPDSPTWVGLEPRTEYPRDGANEGGSNYGNKLSCWVVPDKTSTYVFFVNSDDPSELFLSPDDDPANAVLIARQLGWTGPRQWRTAGGGGSDPAEMNSWDAIFTTGISEWTDFTGINLVAGQKYYLYALHTEGGGGDNVSVTMVTEDDFFNLDIPQDGDPPTLEGDLVGSYLDPNGATIDITEQPQDVTVQEERAATFSVSATGSSAYGNNVSYQWQVDGVDIPGATGPSYTTPLLSMTDNGKKYQVVISVPTLSVTSDLATLTVVPDTFPPQLASAGAILHGGTIEIGVGFDENVDETTAGNAANYSLSKGSVTGVRYQKYAHTDGAGFFQLGTAGPFNGASVVLETSGLAAGDTVTVTVKNVEDTKGNAMSADGETVLARVTGKMKWIDMGGNDYLEGEDGGQAITPDPALWPDDVVALSDSDFDVISSGTANWSNYDESTFVYEEVTGDFDKVVRIEYHDPTSQWARAGMCATPDADQGVSRADVAGGAMQHRRYMNRANPAVQWNGDAGNNSFEADWRLTDGGDYGGVGTGTPEYPHAWLRMQRTGQTFRSFWSNDGENWTEYGVQEFTDEPMPDTLLVGPYYSPEFGNNGTGEGVGHSSVAKFRQYGDFVATPSQTPFALGLNFGADQAGGVLPASGTAGVPGMIQANWNNLADGSGSASNLVADNLGTAVPTTASVEWTSNNTWASTGAGEENNGFSGYDRSLLTGYLDTGDPTTTTVTISDIPADLTGAENGYDVVIYALGGVAAGRAGGYRILDGPDGAVLKDYVRATSPENPSEYTQVTGDPTVANEGTYLVFSGLTASTITVEATTDNGQGGGSPARAPINAVQLVPSGSGAPPEITSIVLNADGTVTVEWTGGVLEAAPTVNGPWEEVQGATSPLTLDPTEPMLFGRVRK